MILLDTKVLSETMRAEPDGRAATLNISDFRNLGLSVLEPR